MAGLKAVAPGAAGLGGAAVAAGRCARLRSRRGFELRKAILERRDARVVVGLERCRALTSAMRRRSACVRPRKTGWRTREPRQIAVMMTSTWRSSSTNRMKPAA